jgi:hypothetical protein
MVFSFDKSARLKIAGYLLLAVTLRSFIAAGWMLQIPAGSGLNAPLLSICPLQTQRIDAWLSGADTNHSHHGGDHSDGDSNASLTISDPSCAIWASTALATVAADHPALALPRIASPIDLGQSFEIDRRLVNSRKTRAPPQLS